MEECNCNDRCNSVAKCDIFKFIKQKGAGLHIT